MITVAAWWFGIGAFAGLMNILAWYYEGFPVHEGEDRYYYLKGTMLNVVMSVLTGPIVIMYQFALGMPIIPRKSS